MSRYQVSLSRRVIRRLHPDFLSFTIDTSVLIGGRWWGRSRKMAEGLSVDRVSPLDLGDPKLVYLAKSLGPALLRVGGTEADRIRYGFLKEAGNPGGESPGETPSRSEEVFVLKKKLWESLADFLREAGLQLLFTVAAGPESRDSQGRWIPQDTIRLISYTIRKKIPVAGWEFGNEVNAFPFIYGPQGGVSGSRYAREFAQFASLVRSLHPRGLRVGPASAIWPLVGEPHPLIPALCRSPAAPEVDVLSFHYYPQQSSRGPLAVRRASKRALLHGRTLDGIGRWIRSIRRSQKKGAAQAQLWVTELGHALYGGEPGLSDTGISTPWWLDQLGYLAYAGVDKVFRQSLVGSDYGLLDQETFQPRPDYYASFFWKKIIGSHVLEKPQVLGRDRKLRAWLFTGHAQVGGVWLVLINLHWNRAAQVEVPAPVVRRAVLSCPEASGWQSLQVNGVTADSDLILNWESLGVQQKYGLRPLTEQPLVNEVVLPPLGCAFVQVNL